MAHMEKRRKLWYAVLTVPDDVRERLGRLRYRKSTGETDSIKAQPIANIFIAEWKAEIEEARGKNPSNLRKALSWRKELSQVADPEERDAAFDVVIDEAERLASKHGDDRAQEFVDIVTGKRTPSGVLFDQWKEQLTLTPKTIDQMERDVQLFVDRFATLEEITKKKALEWLDDMKAQGSTHSSLSRIAGSCRNYWGYLQHRDYIPTDVNPLSNLVRKPKGKGARKKDANLPYSDDELKRIHHGALNQTRYGKPYADQQLTDFILIAIHTGMRLEEVCSLRTEDVTDKALTIVDSKTEAGIRQVPIHSRIASRVKQLKDESKDGYLISGLSDENKYEIRGNAIGKRFQRLKVSLGFELRKHTAHSFRSTLLTKLENAGVSENVAMDIVGHDKPTLTYGHYSGGTTLEVKKAAIEKISYPI